MCVCVYVCVCVCVTNLSSKEVGHLSESLWRNRGHLCPAAPFLWVHLRQRRGGGGGGGGEGEEVGGEKRRKI